MVVAIAALAISIGSAFASPGYHLRLNCGGPEVTDAKGEIWHADRDFAMGGKSFAFPADKDLSGVDEAAPEEVYRSVRHQNHAIKIKDIPAGHYTVRLHLLDAFASHERLMDFHAQGKLALDDINPYEIAGERVNYVVVREFNITVDEGRGLLISCHQDRGNDVFEAALEVVASAPPPAPGAAPVGEAGTGSQSTRGARILSATDGRRTRLVWVQSGNPGDFMVSGAGAVQLRGYDTAQDDHDDLILVDSDDPIQKPMLSHDGRRVVFSDPGDNTCHVIDWDGGKPRSLGSGFAADVWRDPGSNLDWVYIAERQANQTLRYCRRQLDEPAVEEELWNGVPASGMVPWLQLSGDGNRAAEAIPWPKCGVLNLDRPGFNWSLLGNGCWPGMAPDDSYRFFFFNGNHTTLSLVESGERNSRTLAINTIPGLNGARVYHPRWSNHPRFLTVTGPQKSAQTELYLGRFSEDFDHIEAWVQVTLNGRADFYGDAWIEP